MHKNWLLITFLVIAVVGLYFIWENAPIGVAPASEQTSGELFPQNYIIGANLAQFRADGSLELRFHSERLDYYQRYPERKHEDDYATVEAPSITFYQEASEAAGRAVTARENGATATRPEWYLTAQQGQVTQNFKIIELRGDVKIRQPADSGSQISIDTSYLHLDTESQFAHSEEPVMIRYPNASSRGTGFEAKLKEKIFSTLSNGRTVYEPTPP